MALKASIKSCVITPPVGIFQGGYGFRKQHSIGIHDDLHARCIVFSDGTTHAAVVILELLSAEKEIVKKIKDLACNVVPIPRENIIIAAIHTHSGPGPGRAMKGFPRAYTLYQDILPYHVAGLIFWTFNDIQNISIAVGKGESQVGHHRRAWDQASNFVDRELVVAKIIRVVDATTMGVAFNIGCHAVKMNPDNIYFSADWPGFTIKAMQKVLGEEITPVFLQAPCGNINPWNQPFENPPSTFADCRQLGEMVAGDVISALGRIETATSEDLQVKAGETEIVIPPLEDDATPSNEGVSIRTRVQAIVIGDFLAIVGVPGELFSKFGQMIRAGVMTRYCIVQELVGNDLEKDPEIAYVPTKEAYEARDDEHPTGGYEVAAGLLNPNAGYIIVDAAIKLANDLLSS